MGAKNGPVGWNGLGVKVRTPCLYCVVLAVPPAHPRGHCHADLLAEAEAGQGEVEGGHQGAAVPEVDGTVGLVVLEIKTSFGEERNSISSTQLGSLFISLSSGPNVYYSDAPHPEVERSIHLGQAAKLLPRVRGGQVVQLELVAHLQPDGEKV